MTEVQKELHNADSVAFPHSDDAQETITDAQEAITPYNSTISGKGALIAETQMVLQALAQGNALADVRTRVLQENLLSKPTTETRKSVWAQINRRYFSGRSEQQISLLAQVATSPAFSAQTHNLILFYTFAQADRLLYDVTVNLLYAMYHDGRSVVDKADVFRWLDKETRNGHPEIGSWSPQTRSRLVSHLLSITRDFGLLSGGQRKKFHHLYVPLPAFLYVLYDQAIHYGLSGRHLITAEPFRLFLVDQDDMRLLLAEAARADYLTLRHTETIYDIRLLFASLEEAMNHAIAQVVSGT